jgi:dihydrofolate synthase/folylpolyglutamate synthase
VNYRQALDFVLGFADFEVANPDRLRYRDFNLERVRELLSRVGNPHLGPATVHVAGTKGKGSTTAMVASVLSATGHRTGRYTSPHLHSLRERIAIDGAPIEEGAFADGIDALREAVAGVNNLERYGRISTFEALTALAFLAFTRAGVTHSVIEVGLGGRLDATNVVDPVACAVTNVSLDHMDVLGDTLAQIATEKAAIIKPGVPVVSGPQTTEALEVIELVASDRGAPLTLVGRDIAWNRTRLDGAGQRFNVKTARDEYDLWMPLLGAHQRDNAAVAVGVCEALTDRGIALSHEGIVEGLARVSWPGRLEVLSRRPLVVADGAHNPHSIRCLLRALEESFQFERAVVVFGATKTKNVGGMIDELARLPATVLVTESRHPRSAGVLELYGDVASRGIAVDRAEDVAAVLAMARRLAGENDLVLVTGSLFVVAEAREAMLGVTPELYSEAGALTV